MRLKSLGLLKGIKLQHISGDLSCDITSPHRATLWGCDTSVLTIITDNNNEVVFPANIDNPYLQYKVPGCNAKTSQFLVFTNFAYPSFFVKGHELRIWYAEDLTDEGVFNNGGTHCVKVYTKF